MFQQVIVNGQIILKTFEIFGNEKFYVLTKNYCLQKGRNNFVKVFLNLW